MLRYTFIAALAIVLVAAEDLSQWDYGCKTPSGIAAYNYTTCNAAAEASWCCLETDYCLSNGYCLKESGNVISGIDGWSNRIARGACTDWSSSRCPSYCAEQDVYGTDSVDLWQAAAAGTDYNDDLFCCSGAYDQSSSSCPNATRNSQQPFDVPVGLIIYNRTDGATFNGTMPDATSGPAAKATVTTTVTVAATLDPSSAPVGYVRQSTLTTTAAGIAVPLGVLLVGSLIAVGLLMHRARGRRTLPGIATDPESHVHGYARKQPLGRADISEVSGDTYDINAVAKNPSELAGFPETFETDGRPVEKRQ